MRILFWSDNFYPGIGGVEVLGAALVRSLRQRGHELAIVGGPFIENRPTPEMFDDVSLFRFPFEYELRPQSLEMVARIKQQLSELKRTFQPDVVHLFQTLHAFFFHLETARAFPAPTLLTLHGNMLDSTPQINAARYSLLQQMDWIITCSQALLEQTCTQVPEIKTKSSAILNALPIPPLAPTPLKVQPPRILCIGRLHRQKGFDVALDAFARVRETFPGARLRVAGDGAERATLEAQAARLYLGESVQFLGWVSPPRIYELLNQCTFVLMPSRWEPFGLVALQAAQMARPVVAARVDGLPEIVVDRETGLLVQPGDVTAFASAVESLLAEPERAVRMGDAAFSRAQRVFDWERFVDGYEALYTKLRDKTHA
jgi:glycogen synthase